MVSIYSEFRKECIHVNDDYSGPIQIHQLENVVFQVSVSSENNFLTNIGIINGKIQSILNKQFYYVPEKMGGVSGSRYVKELHSAYDTLQTTKSEKKEIISTPVFYFMDYESTSGTGHTYDILFYLLYIYIKNGLTIPIVLPESTNTYYNIFCNLLEKNYPITFYRIKTDTVYEFKTLYCTRTYLNILFPEVKAFINETLVTPILKRYEGIPYSKFVGKIKSVSKIQSFKPEASFPYSDTMIHFSKEKDIRLFDDTTTEEMKIYLLNKATNIIVSWGSIFYIYIDYYLASTDNKFISVLFHRSMMAERNSLQSREGSIIQRMAHAPSDIYQVYNTLIFKGEVVDNLENLESYIAQTALKDK